MKKIRKFLKELVCCLCCAMVLGGILRFIPVARQWPEEEIPLVCFFDSLNFLSGRCGYTGVFVHVLPEAVQAQNRKHKSTSIPRLFAHCRLKGDLCFRRGILKLHVYLTKILNGKSLFVHIVSCY